MGLEEDVPEDGVGGGPLQEGEDVLVEGFPVQLLEG